MRDEAGFAEQLKDEAWLARQRDRYAAGEIMLWEFEEAVDMVLTGAPSLEARTAALSIAAERMVPDERLRAWMDSDARLAQRATQKR